MWGYAPACTLAKHTQGRAAVHCPSTQIVPPDNACALRPPTHPTGGPRVKAPVCIRGFRVPQGKDRLKVKWEALSAPCHPSGISGGIAYATLVAAQAPSSRS